MSRKILNFNNYLGQTFKGYNNLEMLKKTFISNYHFKKDLVLDYSNVRISDNIYENLKSLYYHNLYYKGKKINIGGDHSMSIATVAESLNHNPNIKVLWIDAHADINTYNESKSKNLHGMPLSYLSGLDYDENFDFIKSKLNLNNLMYVGIRDLDDFEKSVLDDNHIKFVDCKEFNKGKFESIFNFMIGNEIHLSFDVDSIDPKYLDSTGTPVDDGLSVDKVTFFLDSLLKYKMNIYNIDLTEINFNLGDKESSYLTYYQIFKRLYLM